MHKYTFLLSSSALVIASLAMGCANPWPTPQEPRLGVAATGEQVWVRTENHQASWVEKEKTGETIHKDSQGNTIGTSESYRDTVKTVHWETWYPMQGETQLDDEDFLRIVGDEQALQEHRDYRDGGRSMNTIGKGMMVGGLLGFVGGLFIPAENVQLRTWTISGGLMVGSGGWYLARAGAARFEADAHTIDPQRAKYEMEQYNSRLSKGQGEAATPRTSISLGGEF